jgi:hypothetical protein
MGGDVSSAWPILVEATTFDWAAAGIAEDSHFTEWAFVEMLIVLADQNDKVAFSSLFQKAVTRCRELGRSFPFVHPKQALLLELCARLELVLN